MDLMAQCGEIYRISMDLSYRRGDFPEKWRSFEIRGKDGALWPYSETHLVIAFYHGWRSRTNERGTLIWIPGRGSRKARSFQTIVGSACEVVQDCDEATCFKVPNKFLLGALKFIVANKKRQVNQAIKARLAQASKSRALILAGGGLTCNFLNDLNAANVVEEFEQLRNKKRSGSSKNQKMSEWER